MTPGQKLTVQCPMCGIKSGHNPSCIYNNCPTCTENRVHEKRLVDAIKWAYNEFLSCEFEHELQNEHRASELLARAALDALKEGGS